MSLTIDELAGVLFQHISDDSIHSGTGGGGSSSTQIQQILERLTALEEQSSINLFEDYAQACDIIRYNLENDTGVYVDVPNIPEDQVGQVFAQVLHDTLADIRGNIPTDSDIDDLIEAYLLSNTATILAGYIKSDTAVFGNATAANFFAAMGTFMNLIADSISATDLASFTITSDHMSIADAFITNAMIENISANKINTGTLNTNNVTISGNNGKMLLADGTITISDGTNIRVQIGEDADGDYNMVVCDEEGNVMWSALGIERAAIKDAIIDDDCIAPNANISASKINISSLISSLNSTGGIQTKATDIIIDADNQKLSAWLNTMNTWKGSMGDRVDTAETSISVIQGQLNTFASKSELTTLANNYTNLSEDYSALEQTVSGLSTTVASNTTTLSTIGDDIDNLETAVQTVQSNTSSLQQTATSLTARIKAVEDAGFATGSDLTSMHSTITTEITAAVGNLSSTVQSQLQTVNANMQDYQDDLEALQDALDAIDIPDYSGDISTLESSVTTLTSSVSTLAQNVSGLSSTVSTQTTTIAELRQDLEGLDIPDISDLEEDVGDLQDDLTTLAARVTTAEGATTTLATTVNGISANVSTYDSRITTLEGKTFTDTATVESMIESHSNTINALADELYVEIAESISNTANGFVTKTEQSEYLRFTTDGLDIGGSSGMHVHVDEDDITFVDADGSALASLTSDSFHAAKFTIKTREYLQLGDYRFIPGVNGTLTLRYIEGIGGDDDDPVTPPAPSTVPIVWAHEGNTDSFIIFSSTDGNYYLCNGAGGKLDYTRSTSNAVTRNEATSGSKVYLYKLIDGAWVSQDGGQTIYSNVKYQFADYGQWTVVASDYVPNYNFTLS